MARHRHYLDTRVLLAFLLASMPFVAFGAFVIVNMARGQLREAVGQSLEQRAIQTKLALEEHVAEHLVHLRLLALDPDVRRSLSAPARPASGGEASLTPAILGSALSDRLRNVVRVRPMMKVLQVVDVTGRVVAASGRGGRLDYSESTWFKELLAQEGEAAAWVGDVARPPGTSTALLDLSFPVRDEAGLFRGAVRGLVDASDLYAVLAPVRIGGTGHAVLVRATDGMILASDETQRVLEATFPGFDSVRGALEGFPLAGAGEALFGKSLTRPGHWTVGEKRRAVEGSGAAVVEPARVVGFSPIDQIPNVRWLVAVEQELAEALAPVQGVTRYLWIHFIAVLAIVILLALYFSFKLERPVMEEELHLHEEHVPSGMRQTEP
jgi:hypothetical protein